MVDHRRMGNMEQQLVNETSATISHQLRDLWKRPRGTVIRIEVLALVAILLSFILAAFGSCRRWSNRWIIQKGFVAANALSLSLGTYSIGLMQSSSVKSEMYPIWAVSLLTLFGSVDSITSYNGLDYKSPLFKALFQLCLYCAYVLLISISTISSDILKIAIGVLSAITFLKGFHRSLAFVLPSRLQNILRNIPKGSFFREFLTDYTLEGLGQLGRLVVDLPTNEVDPISGLPSMADERSSGCITMNSLEEFGDGALESDAAACKGVCLSMALSHQLQQRYFFGLNSAEQSYWTSDDGTFDFRWLLLEKDGITGYDWALKVVEVELAFLYDVFFSSNAFLHYYQAKGATIWTFASALGICFVGVAAAMPGARRSSGHASPADTIVVDSTAADVAITLVVLVSLALLQVLQALRCWTSNWARVALACDAIRDRHRKFNKPNYTVGYRLKLRAFFTRINWFDRQLWQNKLGQYSVIDSASTTWSCNRRPGGRDSWRSFLRVLVRVLLLRARVPRMLGIQYMEKVFWELFGGATVDTVGLHPDVKASLAHVLGTQVAHDGLRQGPLLSPLLSARGLDLLSSSSSTGESAGHRVPRAVLRFVDTRTNYLENIWTFHVATCYCDLAQQKHGTGSTLFLDSSKDGVVKKDHHVATTRSKYCAYLAVSVPELLPGDEKHGRYIHGSIMRDARSDLRGAADKFEAMEKGEPRPNRVGGGGCYWAGVNLGKRLQEIEAPERWSLLADFWVRALLEASPSENAGEHIRHLSQGGEFITHLWAFLYHAGIVKWQLHQEGGK